VQIGEIAAASAGDEDLSAGLGVVVEQGHFATALASHGGTHQTGRSRAQYDDIELARGGGHAWAISR
jgi:hypothetical protein